MYPKQVTVGPLAAASANNIALSQTPTSGVALTLNGSTVASGVATLDVPRFALITYGNEGSARTLRVTGTNADNNPIRETVIIPSGGASTISTTQIYKTITEVLPAGGGWTAAMTLGTSTGAASPWQMLNSPNQSSTQVTFDGHISAGTGTWTIEYTVSPLNDNANQFGGALGNYPRPPRARTFTMLSAKTGDAQASLDNAASAWRLVIDDGGDTTFTVTVTVLEGGVTESR